MRRGPGGLCTYLQPRRCCCLQRKRPLTADMSNILRHSQQEVQGTDDLPRSEHRGASFWCKHVKLLLCIALSCLSMRVWQGLPAKGHFAKSKMTRERRSRCPAGRDCVGAKTSIDAQFAGKKVLPNKLLTCQYCQQRLCGDSCLQYHREEHCSVSYQTASLDTLFRQCHYNTQNTSVGFRSPCQAAMCPPRTGTSAGRAVVACTPWWLAPCRSISSH
jgi:hypothetical protein